jgi:hypothetical protein
MTKCSGVGTIKYDNGDVYEGEFKDSTPHGQGKIIYSDERICEGNWKNGKLRIGTCKWKNGDVYEGELVDGKPNGKGKMIYSNDSDGDVYEGEWRSGEKYGKGTYKWYDGNVYEGDWKSDYFDGEGKYKWPNGDVYEGEWRNGKRHGKGTREWSDGHVYEGEFKSDIHEGLGTYKWPNGDVYKGEWKDGGMHGNGIYNYANGDVYKGVFVADYRHGKGVMIYANKDVYDGEWIESEKHGRGVLKYHNGDVYSGGWSGNKQHGKGIFEYAHGDVLKSIGEWKEGKKDGVFEDVVRTVYENDEVKTSVKRESTSDVETDTEDDPPNKRQKRSESTEDETESEDDETFEVMGSREAWRMLMAHFGFKFHQGKYYCLPGKENKPGDNSSAIEGRHYFSSLMDLRKHLCAFGLPKCKKRLLFMRKTEALARWVRYAHFTGLSASGSTYINPTDFGKLLSFREAWTMLQQLGLRCTGGCYIVDDPDPSKEPKKFETPEEMLVHLARFGIPNIQGFSHNGLDYTDRLRLDFYIAGTEINS